MSNKLKKPNREKRRQESKMSAAAFRQMAHSTDASIANRIEQMQKEMHSQAQNQYMGLMYCIFALALRKVCKFGAVRSMRVLSEIAAVVNDLDAGIITAFDIKRDAEEAGMRIVFDSDYDIIECGIFEEKKYEKARKKIDDERMRLYKENDLDGLRLWTNPDFKR